MDKSKFKEYLVKVKHQGVQSKSVSMKDKAHKIIDGFEILKKYKTEEEATTDQLWAGPKTSEISKADSDRLHSMGGWFIDKRKDRWTIYT